LNERHEHTHKAASYIPTLCMCSGERRYSWRPSWAMSICSCFTKAPHSALFERLLCSKSVFMQFANLNTVAAWLSRQQSRTQKPPRELLILCLGSWTEEFWASFFKIVTCWSRQKRPNSMPDWSAWKNFCADDCQMEWVKPKELKG